MKKKNRVSVANGEYRFDIDIYVFLDDGNYIAYCPSLDICSAGSSYVEALNSFYEALGLYVEYWSEHHTLKADLAAHGWKVDVGKMAPPPLSVLQ